MTEVARIIEAEIQAQGPIPFSRFMELALYCPVYGYYEAEGDKIGRGGDFFTSVSVGSLFGELLAAKFIEWHQHISATKKGHRRSGPVHWVEAGAHNGQLARDILLAVRASHPELAAEIHYVIVEPSERRRAWQRNVLQDLAGAVSWVPDLAELSKLRSPHSGHGNAADSLIEGILFSNELLDSMPVQPISWNTGNRLWQQWAVDRNERGFVWTRLPLDPASKAGQSLATLLKLVTDQTNATSELESILPDGCTIEVCPAAEDWWSAAARCFSTGKLVAIDYGFGTESLFTPERKTPTLRAYRAHHLSQDLLSSPGEQDLTAHVNFPILEKIGSWFGLETSTFTSQERFLNSIVSGLSGSELSWSSEHRRQFNTLTHPEHLGHRFKVLVQSKDHGLG